jgi:hypothetical protein
MLTPSTPGAPPLERTLGYRLQVCFNDGLEGIFPVEPQRRRGVFLELLDASVFNAVAVNPEFGCVEWPGGIDLCLDAMHQDMTIASAELPAPMVLREDAPPQSGKGN